MRVASKTGLYQFDPDGVEAKALEERLGIPVIRHGMFSCFWIVLLLRLLAVFFM